MHAFLNAIATGYLRDPELLHYTFVFPNMRSRRYFKERLEAGGVEAHKASSLCLTLIQMVEESAKMRKTGNERLLYILYRAYCNVWQRGNRNADVEPFDRFRFWGKMLLNDFNDVDRAMADPKEIFRNVEDYKEIQAFYLTDTQKRIIRDYWGDDPYWNSALEQQHADDEVPFWNHVNPANEPERKFTQLWALLGDVYNEFRKLLSAKNECYPAMSLRKVAEELVADSESLPFGPKRFVFIGFSNLSTTELVIFDRLKDKAHFYWDYNPEIMNHCGASNLAGRAVGAYAKRFTATSPYVKIPPYPSQHKVDIIGVPSSVGQAKVAAQCLDDENTAIVLADESMLLPVMTSMPAKFQDRLNVTMGYPLRYSSLAQFYALLTSMQMRTTYDRDGQALFFHDDVLALVSHPGLRSQLPKECAELLVWMRKNGFYNLPANRLDPQFNALKPLLSPVSDNATPEEIGQYVGDALDFAVEHDMVSAIDREVVDAIKGLIKQIIDCSTEFEVQTDRRTFFEIIERTLMQRTLPLEGETFDAMQIMGIQETRSLGFESVIMLSMSDDVFPGRDRSRSFIPETLRRAYGLPTNDVREAEYAYSFYRILSHAQHLTLLYDARCGQLRQGEPSRYLTQLRYLQFPGVKTSYRMASFSNPSAKRQPLISPDRTMEKTPELLSELNKFANEEYMSAYRLSASRLKSYLNCPLSFFLATVNGIDLPEPDRDEPGAAEHGSVVHEVAERIYAYFIKHRNGLVNGEDLETLLKGGFNNLLETELERAMKIHLLHCPPDKVDNIQLGEKEMMYGEPLQMMVRSLFERDKKDTPFIIEGVEKSEVFHWKLSNGQTVNFRIIIDRIDRLIRDDGDIIRIIDYKTGGDATDFNDIDSLFAIRNPKRPEAIFQLFLYCEAYKSLNPNVDTSRLRPQIFKLRELSAETFALLGKGSKKSKSYTPIENYAQVEQEFHAAMEDMFAQLFDPNKPVVRATNKECCRFCDFRALCE